MQTSIIKFKIQFFLIFILGLFFVSPVFAADLSLESNDDIITIKKEIKLDVFVDSKNTSINAVEGTVLFPHDLLEVKMINEGSSIINFWLKQPSNTLEGQIEFSGIIPGGINIDHGKFFSVVFLAKKQGFGKINFGDIKVLINDGEGTEAPLNLSEFQFQIVDLPAGEDTSTIGQQINDVTAPEKFFPQIESNYTIFDGKWFLVFNAQDKGSGIDHYQICEGKRACVRGSSPYILQNQNLDEEIIVIAVDKAGNKRVAKLLSPESKYYNNYYIVIVLLFLVLTYFIYKYLLKKPNK